MKDGPAYQCLVEHVKETEVFDLFIGGFLLLLIPALSMGLHMTRFLSVLDWVRYSVHSVPLYAFLSSPFAFKSRAFVGPFRFIITETRVSTCN